MKNRPLAELAAGNAVPGASGAQQRSVYGNTRAASTGAPPQCTSAVELSKRSKETPQCIIIARPNGAGKTTFAKQFLLQEVNVIHFVNADLIAAGLSPLRPELAQIAAGRLFLNEVKRLAQEKVDFAFETTMSGSTYLRFLKKWKAEGYFIRIIYLRINSPELSLDRIATRVTQGGHDVPREAVFRRFDRSWNNFLNVYRPIADDWRIYENSGNAIQLIEKK